MLEKSLEREEKMCFTVKRLLVIPTLTGGPP